MGDDPASDSSDDPPIEPTLKYQRFPVDTILKAEGATCSCLAAHAKFLALGTSGGFVHILDLAGIRQWKHTPSVPRVVIDFEDDLAK